MKRATVGIVWGAAMLGLLAACTTDNTTAELSASQDPTQSTTPAGATTSSAPGEVQMAENPFAGVDSWIAFHGYDPDRIWLGLVHPDGSGGHRIRTGRPGDNIDPDWSPDGTRLAFDTRGVAPEVLYEYDVNLGTTRQLFTCRRPCLSDSGPAYSPDGERMAFERALGPLVNGVPTDCGLWVGDLGTGRVRQLTSQTDPPCDPHENTIRWSPDGRRLAYYQVIPMESGKVTSAVYTVAVDGTHERRLTPSNLVAGEPAYSPDGKWIVFDTFPPDPDLESGNSQLYRMRPDGSGIEQLTHFESVLAFQPSYSLDGDWIIFSAGTPGEIHLWAIPANGGAPVVISDLDTARTHGTWQPTP